MHYWSSIAPTVRSWAVLGFVLLWSGTDIFTWDKEYSCTLTSDFTHILQGYTSGVGAFSPCVIVSQIDISWWSDLIHIVPAPRRNTYRYEWNR